MTHNRIIEHSATHQINRCKIVFALEIHMVSLFCVLYCSLSVIGT